jgi:hypothetical protein
MPTVFLYTGLKDIERRSTDDALRSGQPTRALHHNQALNQNRLFDIGKPNASIGE